MGGQQQITFEINPRTGVVERMEVAGVQGQACAGITAAFERHFGGDKVDTPLPEFYEDVKVEQQATLGGGHG